MSGRRPTFSDIREAIDRDPQRRARVDQNKLEIYEQLAMHELRRALSMTQEQLAAAMGVTQASIAQIERREDLYLSTMGRYVRALGGRLDLVVHLPDRDPVVLLTALEAERRRQTGESLTEP